MLVLQAYLDESITSLNGRAILILGGYLALFESWLSFSDEWGKVLEKYSLTHFHAKDLPSQHSIISPSFL